MAIFEPVEEIKEDNNTVRWEKAWWKDINETCKTCIHKCKQSAKVDLFCPNYSAQR